MANEWIVGLIELAVAPFTNKNLSIFEFSIPSVPVPKTGTNNDISSIKEKIQ